MYISEGQREQVYIFDPICWWYLSYNYWSWSVKWDQEVSL